MKREKLDHGGYEPMSTKLEGAEYCDPIFRDRGMIGTLDTRQAILAGPFVWQVGCVPRSQVIWVPPTKAKVVISEVSAVLTVRSRLSTLRLYSSVFFDGAVSSPETFEDPLREVWNQRYLDHQRFLLSTIDTGRYIGGRRGPDGVYDHGMERVIWDNESTYKLYNTLTERVWEAGGYGS